MNLMMRRRCEGCQKLEVRSDRLRTVAPEDHRVRVAREKRVRMRTHLLNSVSASAPAKRTVTQRLSTMLSAMACVSARTFYKYFDRWTSQFGARPPMADEMTAGICRLRRCRRPCAAYRHRISDVPVARQSSRSGSVHRSTSACSGAIILLSEKSVRISSLVFTVATMPWRP